MTSKKRLGRGLASLLGTEDGGFEPASLEAVELIHLAVDQIDPNPFQPRRQFDPAELASLADSLRQHGMLQPVLVRLVGDRYQLIAGERRHCAAIEAHLHEIPARVLELDDQRIAELAMVENLQREDLNAIEKATAFRGYLDTYGGTQEELANRLGLDRSTVTNLLRLLDLPQEIQESSSSTRRSPRATPAPCWAWTTPRCRLGACQRVIAENLSVRQTEALVATGEPTPPRVRKLRVDRAHDAGSPSSNKAPSPRRVGRPAQAAVRLARPDPGEEPQPPTEARS